MAHPTSFCMRSIFSNNLSDYVTFFKSHDSFPRTDAQAYLLVPLTSVEIPCLYCRIQGLKSLFLLPEHKGKLDYGRF